MQERWHAIEEVLKWRRRERQVMAERDAQPAAAAGAGKDAYPIRYYYGAEPFSVRRKEFWPLTAMQKLLTSFIPNLSHESDGLIFQVGYCQRYISEKHQRELETTAAPSLPCELACMLRGRKSLPASCVIRWLQSAGLA